MKGGTVRRRAGAAGLIAAATAAAAAGQSAGVMTDQEPPAPTRAPVIADDGPPDVIPQRRPSLNLWGGSGLIDMPSAEMQPDGELSFTSAYIGGQIRTSLTFQALPWLSGTFRYAVLPEIGEDGGTLYDRSFDAKLRLQEETATWPAISIGLQDFLGTGVFSGEYLVATKTVIPELTLTGGVGWGRFASGGVVDNPFGFFSDSFKEREGIDNQYQNTGQVRAGRFFRGEEMGIFAGLEWRTPVEGLSLKAELSWDDYARDWLYAGHDSRVPVNIGIDYTPWDGVELGAYMIQGDAFGLRLSLTGNPSKPLDYTDARPGPPLIVPRGASAAPQGVLARFGPVRELIDDSPAAAGPAPEARLALDAMTSGARWAEAEAPAGLQAGDDCPLEAARRIDAELGVIDGVTFRLPDGAPLCTVVLRPAGRAHIRAAAVPLQGWDAAWSRDPAQVQAIREKALAAVRAEGIEVMGLDLSAERIRIEIANRRYQSHAQALGRTAAALTGALPPSVEEFEISLVENRLPSTTVAMRRSMLEHLYGAPDAAWDSWVGVSVTDAPPEARPTALTGMYPRASWGLRPTIATGLFDPDSPLRADLRLRFEGEVEVAPGLSATASISQTLLGNLDQIDRESDSVLPHVRSDMAKYAQVDTPVIDRLTGDYVFKPAQDLYARFSAGLFERMYGGVGAELLWKPATSRIGLGAELNYVYQRDYDGYFGFRDYNVVTGHASVYWDTGWHGVTAQVDAGRYLAKDYGATFSLTRTFENGWEVGGYFTLTDVPFDDYGEGSFDKGIRLKIPLDWGLPYDTRSDYTATIRPLTRDGGQRLSVANRLWNVVDETDARSLRDDWSLFWK